MSSPDAGQAQRVKAGHSGFLCDHPPLCDRPRVYRFFPPTPGRAGYPKRARLERPPGSTRATQFRLEMF